MIELKKNSITVLKYSISKNSDEWMSEWSFDVINWLRIILVRSTSSIKTIKSRFSRSWSNLLRVSAESTVIFWCQKRFDELRTSSIQDKNRDLDQKSRTQDAMIQLIVERKNCDRRDTEKKESFEHRNDSDTATLSHHESSSNFTASSVLTNEKRFNFKFNRNQCR
jgi:hypothetical protein